MLVAEAHVHLPSTLTTIGDGAFEVCRQLTGLRIPQGVRSIGEGAFSETGISEIDLPDGLEQISASLFARCESLITVRVPATVTAIGALFCDGGRVLVLMPTVEPGDSHIVVPEGVEEILTGAIWRKRGMRWSDEKRTVTIDLPSSIESVGLDAFQAFGCNLLVRYAGKELLLDGRKPRVEAEVNRFIESNRPLALKERHYHGNQVPCACEYGRS